MSNEKNQYNQARTNLIQEIELKLDKMKRMDQRVTVQAVKHNSKTTSTNKAYSTLMITSHFWSTISLLFHLFAADFERLLLVSSPPISWSTLKHNVVSGSSPEARDCAIANTLGEVKLLQQILIFF